ncbi:unnamed protein product [Sphagnum tenellum]
MRSDSRVGSQRRVRDSSRSLDPRDDGTEPKQNRRFIRPTSTPAHRRFFIRVGRTLDASIDAVPIFSLAGETALSDRLRYKARKGNDNDRGYLAVVSCDALFDASASGGGNDNDRAHLAVGSCDALRAENHQGSNICRFCENDTRLQRVFPWRRRRPLATGHDGHHQRGAGLRLQAEPHVDTRRQQRGPGLGIVRQRRS